MQNKIYLIVFVIIMSCACTKKHTVSLSGTFENMPNETIFFEKKGVDRTTLIDSLKLNSSGGFNIKIDVKNNEPSFILLKNKERKNLLLLLAENGEDIKIHYNKQDYTIDGSQGSVFIKELVHNLNKTNYSIDSLNKIIQRPGISTNEANDADKAIVKKLIDHKRNNIRFIVNNTGSFASIFALYQQLPNGTRIFGNTDDFLYFKMVADTMNTQYANNEYVRVLKRDLENLKNTIDLQNKIEMQDIKVLSYPEIELPDVKSKNVKLSSLSGKTILLSFWASSIDGIQMDNKHLLDLYQKYQPKDFEIYQVSLDTDRESWLRSINLQKLPWISVCDFTGTQCVYLNLYNVQKLPANFIIDKNGEVVARNLFGKELDAKLAELCK